MSDFEFIFVLYSLLLGLSMVELLSGLGRTIEARFAAAAAQDDLRIGWLTPLLAVFVMLDLLSFWQAAWTVRDNISVSGGTLMAVMLFASLYFLAARLVFPTQPDAFADLDTHFFRVRRVVLGLLLVLLGAQLLFYATDPVLRIMLGRPLALGLTIILVALMLGAIMAKGRRWCAIVLSLLILRYVIVYLL